MKEEKAHEQAIYKGTGTGLGGNDGIKGGCGGASTETKAPEEASAEKPPNSSRSRANRKQNES